MTINSADIFFSENYRVLSEYFEYPDDATPLFLATFMGNFQGLRVILLTNSLVYKRVLPYCLGWDFDRLVLKIQVVVLKMKLNIAKISLDYIFCCCSDVG